MGRVKSIEHAECTRLALAELLCYDFDIRRYFANRWNPLWIVDAKSNFDIFSRDCGLPTDKRLGIVEATLGEMQSQICRRLHFLPGSVGHCEFL